MVSTVSDQLSNVTVHWMHGNEALNITLPSHSEHLEIYVAQIVIKDRRRKGVLIQNETCFQLSKEKTPTLLRSFSQLFICPASSSPEKTAPQHGSSVLHTFFRNVLFPCQNVLVLVWFFF